MQYAAQEALARRNFASNGCQPLTYVNLRDCCTGNHESECHDPACVVNPRTLGLPLSNFTAFNARWKMPSPESGGVESMWYR